MKKLLSMFLVLSIVCMCSATALAYTSPHEKAAKDYARIVEQAAEEYADAVEAASEVGPQNPKDYVSSIAGYTKTFFGKLGVK